MAHAASGSDETRSTAAAETEFKVWQCILCGFIYDEAEGIPSEGIPAGTRWADVPEDWVCPQCSAKKIDFEMVEV
jgi:rubredoxin